MSEEVNEINIETDGVRASRRDFLKNVGIAGAAALLPSPVSAKASVGSANPDGETTAAELFQGHFVLMSDKEKKKAIERLEKRYTAKYGKKTTVSDGPAPESVLLAMPSISRSA